MIGWDTLKFGLAAMSLERAATKTKGEIEKLQRARLNTLVQHAKQHSNFYREKFSLIDATKFQLAELPTSNKTEMMGHFDDTVNDVSRSDVVAFIGNGKNRGRYFRGKYALGHTSGKSGPADVDSAVKGKYRLAL